MDIVDNNSYIANKLRVSLKDQFDSTYIDDSKFNEMLKGKLSTIFYHFMYNDEFMDLKFMSIE